MEYIPTTIDGKQKKYQIALTNRKPKTFIFSFSSVMSGEQELKLGPPCFQVFRFKIKSLSYPLLIYQSINSSFIWLSILYIFNPIKKTLRRSLSLNPLISAKIRRSVTPVRPQVIFLVFFCQNFTERQWNAVKLKFEGR